MWNHLVAVQGADSCYYYRNLRGDFKDCIVHSHRDQWLGGVCVCVCVCVCVKVKILVTQSCLTLWDPVDYSPPGSSVHGISQARILGWVVIPLSRGSSQSRGQTQVSCLAGRFFTIWATREASVCCVCLQSWKEWYREWGGRCWPSWVVSGNRVFLEVHSHLDSENLGFK